jgi:5-methylcytosine-specific restriction endonuclease McrA
MTTSDYGSGSLATMLVDKLTSGEWQDNPILLRVVYGDYIKSDAWKTRSRQAKVRAGYHCQLCNKPGNDHNLHTHHNNYEHLGQELETDLIVLCNDCHKKHHKMML